MSFSDGLFAISILVWALVLYYQKYEIPKVWRKERQELITEIRKKTCPMCGYRQQQRMDL